MTSQAKKFENRLEKIQQLESDIEDKMDFRSKANPAIPAYFVEVASELYQLAVPLKGGLNMPEEALGMLDGSEIILEGVEGLYETHAISVMLRQLSEVKVKPQSPNLDLKNAELRLEKGSFEQNLDFLENFIEAVDSAIDDAGSNFNHIIPRHFLKLMEEMDSKARKLANNGRKREAAGLAEAGVILGQAVIEMYELDFSSRLLKKLRG